jgi:hypothetical protein
VVERFADDEATYEELGRAEAAVDAIWRKNAGDAAHLACNQLFSKDLNGLHVSTSTLAAAFRRQLAGKKTQHGPMDGRRKGACPEEERAQSRLLRDIFGNPFRPIHLNLSWLTSTVVALANGIRDEKAFDRMPILADALQDAWCDNDEILKHCREPGKRFSHDPLYRRFTRSLTVSGVEGRRASRGRAGYSQRHNEMENLRPLGRGDANRRNSKSKVMETVRY